MLSRNEENGAYIKPQPVTNVKLGLGAQLPSLDVLQPCTESAYCRSSAFVKYNTEIPRHAGRKFNSAYNFLEGSFPYF
jgi:hypothetical protein